MALLLSIFKVAFIILGLMLIGLILLRRPEGGGGLGGAFGGSSSEAVFGVKAAQTLDKIIASVALAFLIVGTLMHTKLLRPSGLEKYKEPKKSAPAEPGKDDKDSEKEGKK